VTELKRLIDGLIRGEQTFEVVSAALDQLLDETPDSAPGVARLLQSARESGLAPRIFAALNGQIGTQTSAPGSSSVGADATVFAADSGDATVFAGDDEDPNATVFADLGDVATTEVEPPRADFDPEATVFDDSSDVTVVEGAQAEVFLETAISARPFEISDPDSTSQTNPRHDEATSGDSLGANTSLAQAQNGGDSNGGDDGFDTLSETALGAADDAAETPTGGPVAGVDREFQEGDLLRGRFELISKLGEGGMGAVWKGKDKLKEEARDRNPFVAIKLLHGNFKSHPEAFIALQRETAKQQRLAHPNIATVFDFDRDDNTGTVFMTMEVMEGQPMDAYIRKLPAEGLSEEEAMPLVAELCAGLSYAHAASLVHSDLKPGNCFYTKEGHIKLLDFGIARASETKDDAVGETTLFDPGTLGALTPTYATIEMFEGDDPDPRDDIYALAIMTYQLLTGKHPYGNKSAPKAKELGLGVEPTAKLNKRQNKGLARGLAFMREDRAETVEVFLESMTRKKSRASLWVSLGLAATVLLTVGAYNPIMNYMNEGKREGVIVLVQQGGVQGIRDGLEQAKTLGDEQFAMVLEDPRVISAAVAVISADNGSKVQSGLAMLAAYPEDWQRQVLDDEATKKAIFGHYEQQVQLAFAPAVGHFDFPAAKQSLDELKVLYLDSKQAFLIAETLNESKRVTLASLNKQYKSLKYAGKLIPVEKEDDIADVLLAVKAIDAEHRLLSDELLPARFAEEARKAIEVDRNYQRADALLVASAEYAPNHSELKGLRYDLNQILTKVENEKRIAELESRLSQAEPGLKALPDYQRVRDELVTLADLSAQSTVLNRIQGPLKSAFGDALTARTAASNWQEAEDLLFSFARLLSIGHLTRQRVALTEAENAAGFTPYLGARKPAVDGRVAAVTALLAKPEFTIDWETRLKVPYKELLALLPLGNADLEQVRTATARLMLGASLQARKDENFNQAREFVAKGLEFYPGLKNFSDEGTAINSAERKILAKRAELERLAKIKSHKVEFEESAQANDIQSAQATLQAMTALGVKTDDPFLSDTAPQKLADAYQRLSKLAAGNDRIVNAAQFAQQGLKLNPGLSALSEALSGYQIEMERRERETKLEVLFASLKPIKVAAVQQSLSALKKDIPKRFDALVKKLAEARATQLRDYSRTNNVKIDTLAARTREFSSLFPRAGASLSNELADAIEPRLRKVDARSSKALAAIDKPLAAFAKMAPKRHAKLSATLASKTLAAIQALTPSDKAGAATLLRAAKAVFPKDRAIAKLIVVIPMQEITDGLAQMHRGKLAASMKNLAVAKAKDAKHPELSPFETQLGVRRKQADGVYAQHIAKAEDPLGYKAKDEIRALFKQAAGLCSDCRFKERSATRAVAGLCHPGLAGFGAKRAGQCWDKLGRSKGKGPMMVVVPSGGGATGPFAIGKYEVSQRDFNAFCNMSKQCKVVIGSKSRLPATGITAQLAEGYAKWLSKVASRALKQKVVYRLPTAAEWAHAANAGGAQPAKKGNCRVMSAGQIISGHDLIDATSGHQNGWGLANYVGNAKELVRAGGGFAARGGDFEESLTKCNLSISEPHSGSADATTGFRLVRELG
jgi:serine/threonine protein kinase